MIFPEQLSIKTRAENDPGELKLTLLKSVMFQIYPGLSHQRIWIGPSRVSE